MSSLGLNKKGKTEFELLLSNQDLLPNTDADSYPLAKILDEQVARTVENIVDFVISQNSDKTTHVTLQNMASKIPSTIYVKYARAGKNYITIEHKMGHLGNLFFCGMFDKIVKENNFENNYTILEQNKICFIFRQ